MVYFDSLRFSIYKLNVFLRSPEDTDFKPAAPLEAALAAVLVTAPAPAAAPLKRPPKTVAKTGIAKINTFYLYLSWLFNFKLI